MGALTKEGAGVIQSSDVGGGVGGLKGVLNKEKNIKTLI